MRRLFTVAAAIFLFLSSGCAGPNSSISTKNIETAAAIDSAVVPGSAIIGVPLAAVDVVKYVHDYCASIGMPKVGKPSQGLLKLMQCTPLTLRWDDKGNPQWDEYAYCRENGKVEKIKLEDVPKIKLNYRLANAHATSAINQGILSDGDKELLQHNLETWKKGGLLAIEYHGPEGATVVAVSNKNEPFEIMLPEEWELRKSQYGLTPEKTVIPVEKKAKEGSHP
jgi:hypothetical protein